MKSTAMASSLICGIMCSYAMGSSRYSTGERLDKQPQLRGEDTLDGDNIAERHILRHRRRRLAQSPLFNLLSHSVATKPTSVPLPLRFDSI
jgi:hypothetical protein